MDVKVKLVNKNRVTMPEKYILRLRKALESGKTNACCLCLDSYGELWPLDSNLLIAEVSGCYIYTMTNILEGVFGPLVPKGLLSKHVCKPCKDAAISAFTFINNTKSHLRVYQEYITQLISKSNDVFTHCLEENNGIGNVLFVLDNPKEIMNEHKKNKPSRRKARSNTLRGYDINENDPRPYKCNMCEGEYSLKRNLRVHKYRQHKVRISKSNYDCSICHKKFSDLKTLRYHMSVHNPNEKHVCKACDLTFATRKEYLTHTRRVTHGKSSHHTKRNQRRHRRRMNCSVCGKEFSQTILLKEHMESHDPDEKHQCRVCNLLFDTRLQYVKHTYTLLHRKIEDPDSLKPYLCNQCDYITYDKSRLAKHMIIKHFAASPYICSICNRKFATSTTLRIHMDRHRSLRKEHKIIFNCDICGQILSSTAAAKKHHRLHTGERPYPCDQCAQAFRCASDRTAHKKCKHTPRDIGCPLCNTYFHTVSNLRSHVKKVHWKRDEKFDYRKLEGLAEADYELFKDKRLLETIKVDENDSNDTSHYIISNDD